MSDLINLRLGARPWAPANTAEDIEVLDYYDMPLTGILQQHGVYFLYHCLEGQLGSSNLWAYVLVEPTEVDELLASKGDELDEIVQRLLFESRRNVTVAISLEEHGLVLGVVAASFPTTRIALISAAMDGFKRVLDDEYRAVRAVGDMIDYQGIA